MAQNEYKIIYDQDYVDMEKQLNESAGEGWRLHSAIPGHYKGDENWSVPQFIMEREKPEAKKVLP